MVKDHSYSQRGNPLPPHGLLFQINSKVLLYTPSHSQDSTYHCLCYTSRGALAGMRNSSMGPPHEGSIRRPIARWANTLTTELHLAPWWRLTSNWLRISRHVPLAHHVAQTTYLSVYIASSKISKRFPYNTVIILFKETHLNIIWSQKC